MKSPTIRLVVLDWAGTAIDHGCLAPTAAFCEAFRVADVPVTMEEARVPMGLAKWDHLAAIAALPRVAEAWQRVYGRPCERSDIDRMYEQTFIPAQLAVVADHCDLTPGLLETVEALRRRDIKIATTTGYFREAAEIARRVAADRGYRPDADLCPQDVPAGRPWPWMIFRHMERFGIAPPTDVLKVGDTVPDVEEGLAAGVWTVGVTQTSSLIGLSEADWSATPTTDQESLLAQASETLLGAGAHATIRTLAELPDLIDRIEATGRGPTLAV